jgi:hypothetical protein
VPAIDQQCEPTKEQHKKIKQGTNKSKANELNKEHVKELNKEHNKEQT